MTISANVRKELFEVTSAESKLIRIKPTEAKAGTTVYSSKQSQPLKMWTQEEHEKFLEAMEKFPAGPWKVIAAFIGTKTTRQTMTHAQKYRQKISRWRRGLRHKGRKHTPDGQGSASGSDTEYSAKESLFKAIDYVSGDDTSQPSGQARGSRASGTRFTSSDGGNQLFRLAELASIEVMKGSPTKEDSPDPAQENSSANVNSSSLKQVKSEWQAKPSREWQKAEVKLSPLKQSEKQRDMSAAFQQAAVAAAAGLSDEKAAQQGGSFRLPPLMMPQPPSGLAGIPPLRSKIDPSVLNHAQFAATN